MRAIETPFLTCLIFIQFEANLEQSNFEYKFYSAYKQKFWKYVGAFADIIIFCLVIYTIAKDSRKRKFATTIR